jgi:hypothetical protein
MSPGKRSSTASAPAPAESVYDAALHLLDRQVVDPDGRMVAKVDDLEVTERSDGRLVVTAILTGPGALGPRIGGRLGRWSVAIWRRLHPDEVPSPGRIDIADVTQVASAVHVSGKADELALFGFERWTRDHVIQRIPGASDDPQ